MIPEHLEQRARRAEELLDPCRLCPRECGASRSKGQTGFCGETGALRVASAGPHFGEEPPLVGTGGSGTVFLTGCNLGCVFCQNPEISTGGQGSESSPEKLAGLLLDLQRMGCHNVNFVTPTHQVPGILRGIALARSLGLRLPVVYNCGGYESLEVLELLDGIVDIYMPDFKFLDARASEQYLQAPDYPEVALESIRFMQRQVGALELDQDGIARRGLLVRHLVMPGLGEDTEAILGTLAREISPDTYVNVMDQYRSCHRAAGFPEIHRRPTGNELSGAIEAAQRLGLTRGLEAWRRTQ